MTDVCRIPTPMYSECKNEPAIQESKLWAGEMAQQLKAQAAPAEDPGSTQFSSQRPHQVAHDSL